jgi:tRNA nucleotidyltransferase (CCA-adding enzyme)
MQTYLVGGAVRDKLLDLPVRERDWVVVGATPERMIAQGFRPVGKEFPVFLHPETHEEYALARTERKVGPGYKGFVFHAAPDVSLEEDLRRRDLTINAMAETAAGELIDPFNGQSDLHDGVLRHVSTAFAEDPVRILRVARFAARFGEWGFRVAHDTNKLMRQMVDNGEVDALVPERVWAELEKTLATRTPARFFEVLHGCGALGTLFPELEALFGDNREAHAGPAANDIHALRALNAAAQANAPAAVCWAVLLLALGDGDDHHADRIRALSERFRIPNEFRDMAITAARLRPLYRQQALSAETLLRALETADAWRRPQRFHEALHACAVDVVTSGGDPGTTGQLLQRALQATIQVDTASLTQQDLKGQAMAAAVRQLRLAAIQQQLA